MPAADWPTGDGSLGTLEGYSSTIRADGSQPMRYAVRNDNVCEVAMLMALDASHVARSREHRAIAVNLLDYIFLKSGLAGGQSHEPASPEYGLVGWSLDLPTLSIGATTAADAVEHVGRLGVVQRGGSWGGSSTATPTVAQQHRRRLLPLGRRHGPRPAGQFPHHRRLRLSRRLPPRPKTCRRTAGGITGTRRTRDYSPHYVGWIWACYLWAYDKTHFEPLPRAQRNRHADADAGVSRRWYWTDRSGSIERARALLPLAWLVRVQDTPEHRGWLRRVARDLIALQDPSGAIRETIGGGGHGTLTNAEYGTCETSLIQTDGDPIADMLYTCNFAADRPARSGRRHRRAALRRRRGETGQVPLPHPNPLRGPSRTRRGVVSRVRFPQLGVLGQQRRLGMGPLVYRNRLDPALDRRHAGPAANENLALGFGPPGADQQELRPPPPRDAARRRRQARPALIVVPPASTYCGWAKSVASGRRKPGSTWPPSRVSWAASVTHLSAAS